MSKLDLAIAEAERSPLVQAAKARIDADVKANPKLSKEAFRKFVAPGWAGLAGISYQNDYWTQVHKTLDSLPAAQRDAWKYYDRLLNAKSKQGDGGLGIIKAVTLGIAGFGIGQAFNAFGALSASGNAAPGISLSNAAAPGVSLTDPLIGTGVKLTGSTVLDGAVGGSSLLSGFSLSDVTKTGSTLFKTAQAVNTIAGAGGGGSGGTASESGQGDINVNFSGVDLGTGSTSPIGAKSSSGSTPPVIDLTSGGGGGSLGLPLLLLAIGGYALWRYKK